MDGRFLRKPAKTDSDYRRKRRYLPLRQKDRHLYPLCQSSLERNLTCIVQDRTHNYFWVGTSSSGLLLFNPSAPKDSVYTYSPLPVNPMGETEGEILYMEQDSHEGELLDDHRSTLISMRYDEAHRSLRQTDFRLPAEYGNMLNEIYQDKEGNLWVAFWMEKFHIHFTENAAETHAPRPCSKEYSFQPAIMALSDAGRRQNVDFARERTGLGLYNLSRHEVMLYSNVLALKSLALGSIKQMTEPGEKATYGSFPKDASSFIYELGREGMRIEAHPYPESSRQGQKALHPNLRRPATARSGLERTTDYSPFTPSWITNGIRCATHWGRSAHLRKTNREIFSDWHHQ